MENDRNQWRWIISIAAFFAVIFPVVSIFNKAYFLLGIPLLYIYLFFLWACMIYLTYRLTRRNKV
jgi:hypothetical protein